MNTEEFNEILDNRIEQIRKVLGAKAKEYAFGDRLHNFKVAAGVMGNKPVQAAWGMALKHLVSVIDLIEGRLEATPEMVDEKIGDMINYLILIEASLKEPEEIEVTPEDCVVCGKTLIYDIKSDSLYCKNCSCAIEHPANKKLYEDINTMSRSIIDATNTDMSNMDACERKLGPHMELLIFNISRSFFLELERRNGSGHA